MSINDNFISGTDTNAAIIVYMTSFDLIQDC